MNFPNRNSKRNVRENKGFLLQKKQDEPKYYTNYYNTIVDIAEDLGSLTFYVPKKGNPSLKMKVTFTKDGMFINNELEPKDEFKAKTTIQKNKENFKQSLVEKLMSLDLFKKYAPVLQLALLSDQCEYVGRAISFTFYYNGLNSPFILIPGKSTMTYYYQNKEVSLDVARAVIIKFYPECLLQARKAVENAVIMLDKENGTHDKRETEEAKKRLGIKQTTVKGKTMIDAGSVLKKEAGQEASDEVKIRAQLAKESIFGTKNRFS